MANALLTTSLPKNLGLFRVMSETPDTVTGNEVGIHNYISVDGVTFAPSNTQGNDETSRISDTQKANNHRKDDESDGSNARIIGDFPVQHILKLVETGRGMNYILTWSGYGPEEDTVKQLQQIPQHFITRYWRGLNRRKARKRRI